MTTSTDYTWMRLALGVLFDGCTDAEALGAIRDTAERARVAARVGEALAARPGGHVMPAGELGDNLLLALLALRVKFPRDEAMAKVELNIAMRQQRDGREVRRS